MKFIKNEKGQSLVEFALLVPLLILILMSIIEFGLFFNSFIIISNSTREGARLGSLGGTDIEIELRIKETATALDSNKMTISITPNYGSRSRGDMITVKVTYDYVLISPIVSEILSPSINLVSDTSMRME